MGRGMEMDGCGKVIQILMFVANFIIWLGSIIILVFGIWAVVDRPYLETVLAEGVYISAAYILITVGAITFFLSFLGCFGAIKEIKCMLLLYFILVLLLFIILLVGGILGVVFHNQAEDKIKMGMRQTLKSYNEGNGASVTKSWDEAQSSMKCCGIDSQTEWQMNSGFKGSKKVPRSCCKKDGDGTVDCTSDPDLSNSYMNGCYDQIKDFVQNHAKYIGGAGIAVSLIMIFGMIFSIMLFIMIK